MTQALATTTGTEQPAWSQEDIDLIRATVAKGANPSEFKLLLYIATKYQLDPLTRQIWCISYGNTPAAIFTSRDGFLSIAHRSGQFDGMETQAVRNDKGTVTGAVCRVWRRDMSHPFTVEVSRSEYDTTKGNWQKMPETMIKKVAESQCLRRAFDISGIYDPSEYDPSENAHQQPIQQQQPQPQQKPVTQAKPIEVQPEPEMISQKAISQIVTLAGNKGLDEIDLAKMCVELYGKPLPELEMADGRHFYAVLQGK